MAIAVCRIAPAIKALSYLGAEIQDIIDSDEPRNLFWYSSKPHEESLKHKLFREVHSRALLIEPCSRAARGLKEVFGLEVAGEKMEEEAGWWRETNAERGPRARWLGIFRPQVQMKENIARGLTIPDVKVLTPHTLGAFEVEHLGEPN